MALTSSDYDAIYQRDNFTCAYCGFDGRPFDNWMQLEGDHIRPLGQGGVDARENLITVCGPCNSLCSNMEFSAADTVDDILKKKQTYVEAKRKEIYGRWQRSVVNYYDTHPFRPAPTTLKGL